MRIRNVAFGVVATLGIAQFASAAQIVPAVGDFDPVFAGPVNGQANPSVGSAVSNEPGMTVATWQTRIGDAYSNGLGGVWNGSSSTVDDTVNSATASDTVWQLTIPTGKSFAATATTAIGFPTGFNSMNAISGQHYITSFANPQLGAWGMSFSLAGFDPSAKITELGFANIGRTGTVGTAVSFTVTYDDLTTATNNLTPLPQGSAALVHFLAPTGKSISKLDMVINGTRGIQLDDVGVIVSVPEPATAALVGVALMGLALRRRKA